MSLRIILFLFALLPAAFPVHAADLNPGNWEVQVTTQVPGSTPATLTQNQCLRAEDAKNPGMLFGTPDKGCEFLNQRDDGKVYRFDILCKDPTATVTGSGEMRYGTDTMEGELVIRTVVSTQTMDLRSRIRAQRVGPCK
jgi:hypothetical protein